MNSCKFINLIPIKIGGFADQAGLPKECALQTPPFSTGRLRYSQVLCFERVTTGVQRTRPGNTERHGSKLSLGGQTLGKNHEHLQYFTPTGLKTFGRRPGQMSACAYSRAAASGALPGALYECRA